MEEIRGENFTVFYAPDSHTVTFEGSCRLYPDDYEIISQLLTRILEESPETITLDLRQLEYLNSSGISMLTSFVINIRNLNASQLVVLGSRAYPWQNYSLRNFQRLLPSLELEVEAG
jgi:hypothetical protein